MGEDNGLDGSLDGVTAPTAWSFLDSMRSLNMSERGPHLQTWLDLVGKRELAERDALITEGRSVFGYRMETIREHLRTMREVRQGVSKTAVTIATEEYLAEMIYQRGAEKEFGYLVHRFGAPDDAPEFVETMQVGKAVIYPPTSSLLEMGTILLPSAVEEYGSDWDLFDGIRQFIGDYVHLTSVRFKTLAACYVLMSWMFDRFEAVPYLRAQGDLGTGKSRLLQVIGGLCYRAIWAGGATTPAPIFRIIDRYRGTMIIDEADFGQSEFWHDIIKILNFGYQKGFPVLRAERSSATQDAGFDVVAYDCYCPKILATRRRFGDAALESRCFSHTMPLVPAAQIPRRIPLQPGPEFRAKQQGFRNQLLLWRMRHYNKVEVDPTFRVDGVEPRVNQIVQPLIACVSDQRIRDTIVQAMVETSERVQAERSESYEGTIAKHILRIWAQRHRPPDIQMAQVVEQLQQEPEMKEMGSRKVADLIRRSLQVKTFPRGGVTWIATPADQVRRLSAAYRIGLEEFGGI